MPGRAKLLISEQQALGLSNLLKKPLLEKVSGEQSFCDSVQANEYPANGCTKKAGILDSGLVDYEMVAGVRFELTTFGLCDLTQLSLRVGLYLHPV